MIYKFLMISDEVEDFARKIAIDADATFFDLHEAILDAVGYSKDIMTSFFTCSDNWEKEQEITLEEMDTAYDKDNWVMAETKLSEFISDEGQRLMYVFDYLTERAFYIELKEIETGKSLAKPECILSKGEPPAQEISYDEFENSQSLDIDSEDFYGDEEYNLDELDEEGYNTVNPEDESSF